MHHADDAPLHVLTEAVPYFVIACRALLVVVFLAAVLGKVRRRAAFREFAFWLATLRYFRQAWAVRVALLVTGTETAAVVLLAVPVTAPAGLALSAALLALFAGGVATAVRRNHRAPCRCFGASSVPLGRVHAARNVALAVVAAAGLLVRALVTGGQPPAVPGVAVALAVAAVLAAFAVRLDDVAAVLAARPHDTTT